MSMVCGISRIVGCRFSLYPMSDRFVDIIMGTLAKVDRSKVWLETDDVSTCIRGRASHVFDVAQAMFVHAASTGVHVVLNATFSIGCPGDTEGDVFMSLDDERQNAAETGSIPVLTACQFALYPMGDLNYMNGIYEQINFAKENGTYGGGVHYASRLDGDAHAVFHTLEHAFDVTRQNTSHVVMTAVLSANSPSSPVKARESHV